MRLPKCLPVSRKGPRSAEMNEHILLVEDEQALRKATNMPFDLIVLGVMLPVRNGFEVCREVRQQGMATPILMLTVRDKLVDKVVGLNLGADDYMTKPFESEELIARIQALLRRVPILTGQGVYEFSSIHVNVPRREITRDGKPVDLTRREFQLLCYLMERRGTPVHRRELLRSIWGYDTDAYTRTIDTHVASLRRKLEEDPGRPQLIVTIPNVGYKFQGSSSNS